MQDRIIILLYAYFLVIGCGRALSDNINSTQGCVPVSNKSNSSMSVVLSGLALIFFLIIAIYYLTAARFQSSGMDSSGIADRIAPVGQVAIAEAEQAVAPAGEGTSATGVASPVGTASSATAAGNGEDVYNRACIACHMAGVAGAPKLGDAAAWGPRIDQGMDVLMNTVLNGKNAMPPRGTCAACSDEELQAAVEFMVSKAR